MMKVNIDEKYILQLSTRFPKLSKTSKGSYSCRCGYCGDSEKLYKKSASFYLAGGTGPHFNYICHRSDCDKRISLKNLLKELEPKLYEAYWTSERYNICNHLGEVQADAEYIVILLIVE